jgi:uncharacterized protein (TIGR02266 family)
MRSAAEDRLRALHVVERRTSSGVGLKQEEMKALGAAHAVRMASDAECFEALRERLSTGDQTVRPWLEPRSVASSALLVADCMAQPEPARKIRALAEAGTCRATCVDDLRLVARAVLFILSKLDEATAASERLSHDADADARELRSAMIHVVERELHENDDARLWLDVVRGASDEIDLVLDLRCLASVYRTNAAALAATCDVAGDEMRARRLADALEAELTGDDAGTDPWREWLARAWMHLVAVHEQVCRIGRFLLPHITFPSLPMIARMRRRQVHEAPRAARLLGLPRLSAPPAAPARLAPAPLPTSVPAPLAVLTPAVESVAPEAVVESFAPPSPRPIRAEARHRIELEVDFASDSNFYVGFSENLTAGGVFVATYVLRPVGSIIDLSIRLAGEDEPLQLRGEVRWIRELSWASDLWPGMGVRFDAISPENEARIRDFLEAREPLFFAE